MASFKVNIKIWILGTLCLVAFGGLLAVRLDLVDLLKPVKDIGSLKPVKAVPTEHESWMKIMQGDRKIGYAHRFFAPTDTGHTFKETVRMRINTMGMIQDIKLKTTGRLNPDYTLAALTFDIHSGPFNFSIEGTTLGNRLTLKTSSIGPERETVIELKQKPYLLNGLMGALQAADHHTGDKIRYTIFDPATMGQIPVEITILGQEPVTVMGQTLQATKIALRFRGMTQMAWIDGSGDILKEEGLLGIRLEKTTAQAALDGLSLQSSNDLTKVASVPVAVSIDKPSALKRLTVAFAGIDRAGLTLDGGRQKLIGNLLIIEKETLRHPEPAALHVPDQAKPYTGPTAFVQSDHPRIVEQAQQIVRQDDPPARKAKKLVEWVFTNIEKRPVLSLPDAISTLENRVGDCNEHAVLLAALARAVGIPAKIEAGLVYLQGRFYYHAWNLLFVGQWITADALFGQMPVDVTHIRFTSGAQPDQLELMNVIGRIKLRIIKQEL